MPAFFTHYAFGIKNYKKMEYGYLKKIIHEHKTVYSLGNIGPDIFLYYFPDMLFGEKKPGTLLHEKHSRRFFENMLKRAELFSKKKREIAYAYIAGFVGHYELDVHCHPLVYYETENADARKEMATHFSLEGAMDVFCSYEYLYRLPTELKQKDMIKLSREERKVLCILLADAYQVTYHKPWQPPVKMWLVLQSVRAVITFLEDRRGWKESVWTRLEKRLYGHVYCAPLFINNNTYQYTVEDWYEFHELWRDGLKEYQSVIVLMDKYVSKKGDKRNCRKELLMRLGNQSYHAGKVVG